MTKILLFISTLIFSVQTHAQSSQQNSQQQQQGSGGNSTAGSSAVQSLITAGTNGATAAMMFSQCPPVKCGFICCVMGGLSVAQMGADLLTSKSSRNAAQAFVPGGGVADWDTTDLGNGLTGGQLDNKLEMLDGKFQALKDQAKKNGIDIDSGIVNTPKGPKSLASLGSGAAMAAAGLIPEERIEEIDEMLKKNAPKLPNITLNNSTGGGGGSASRTTASYEFQSPDYSGMFGDKEKPNAPKTAGLVKTINGQSYGASVNNIFDMIRNRYDIKTREKFFVE